MQRIIASILMIAFLGHTLNQGWYCLDYVIQKKEYIKRCENKARPQLHCNGKCQLMKKLREQEKREQGEPPELKLASKSEAASSRNYFISQLSFSRSLVTLPYADGVSGTPVDRAMSIDHPPGC